MSAKQNLTGMNLLSGIETFTFGEDIYNGGGRFGPVSRPQMEFILIQNGAARVEIDHHHLEIIEGYSALVLSRQYLCYDYQQGADTRALWCEASLPRLVKPLQAILPAQPLVLPVSRRMLELQRMGMDLGLHSAPEDEMLRAALGRALFQEFLYQAHRITRDRPIHRSVIRAKDFIERNISTACTLDQVAGYSNVSPQHLTRIFKRDMKQTPIQYLWTLRARKGAQMLRRTGLPIAQIAYHCGYENANHFSRHIKERFEVTPTELRRRRWQE